MPSFRITLKGGRPIGASALAELVGKAVVRGGLVVQAGIMATSPVRSGTLRRSWTTGQAEIRGSRVRVVVGTNLVYARYQDRRTRNKGYVGAGIQASREQAMQAVRDAILAEKDKLWAKGNEG